MKSILYSLMLIATLVSYADAAIRLVDPNLANNSPNTFHTLQDAHNVANNGDTIYVLPGGSAITVLGQPLIAYDSIQVSKRLVWIGSGYFLNQNTGTQKNTNETRLRRLFDFAPGSAGTVVEGFSIGETGYTLPTRINQNDIIIRRCRFYQAQYTAGYVYVDSNNVVVEQCYFDRVAPILVVRGNADIVRNCYIGNCVTLEPNGTVQSVYNNVLFWIDIVGGAAFNNIVIEGMSVRATEYDLYNNVFVFPESGHGINNISNFTESSLFVGGTHPENKYRLAISSPAIGAGYGGVDCGMFAGVNPYLNSGMPPIPSISNYSSPAHATPTSGLSVTIEATAHP